MSRSHKSRLSKNQVQQIRKQLRELDGEPESLRARIGRIISYPPSPAGNVRRYRFGMALMLLAVFLMLLVVVLPDDDRRWLFAGFSILMVAVAVWQIDLAKER